MLNILSVYLLGATITAIVLGYRGYDENEFPPAPIVIMFWPMTLVVFFFLQLYGLGHYLKKAKEARARRTAAKKLLRETIGGARLEVTPPRPSWLGPSPK